MNFNTEPSTLMHIDLNSCFATVEQQANPLLRGYPIAVAAYDSPKGCILAPSIEAKRFGIKTGMRVKDARLLYKNLKIIEPDADKYRFVHKALHKLLLEYTNSVYPKSIDEFVLNFKNYPILKSSSMSEIGVEIKRRIKKEIGEWLTVSIGIGTSRFIAKTASSLKKPDGLDEINYKNFLSIYENLKLTDLNGIAFRNERRLMYHGINSVLDFHNASIQDLKSVFSSMNGYYWYLRLRGFEIDDFESERKTFGNSFALPRHDGTVEELLPILQKLCEKTGGRLRSHGYEAMGVHVSMSFKNSEYWHMGQKLVYPIFDSRDIYKSAVKILLRCDHLQPVHILAVTVFNLSKTKEIQFNLFEDVFKKESLVKAVDDINNSYGDFVIHPVRMLWAKNYVKDRIAFGK